MRCFRKWIYAIGHAACHEARDVATTAIPHKRIEIRNLKSKTMTETIGCFHSGVRAPEV